MGTPFVGEIRLFGGNFAPSGWGFCDGSLQSIAENETLFQLIGTTYGGDGQSTFALPDLRGRVPLHFGQGPGLGSYIIGETGGTEQVTLSPQQIPSHTHPMVATATGQADTPQNNVMATVTSSQIGANAYDPTPASVPLLPASIGQTGGSQPHANIQPTLAISYIISFFGIFPSPS